MLVNLIFFLQDIGIYQSPEKVRTEEEKAVDQILGPAQNVDLEVASPPGKKVHCQIVNFQRC